MDKLLKEFFHQFSIYKFYIDNEEKNFISLDENGIIITNKNIRVLDKNNEYKEYDASQIYNKNILDLYEEFFSLGLDTEFNKQLVEFYKKRRDYVQPVLKEYTQEEIDAIHKKELLTQHEKIYEIEHIVECCPFTNGCERCTFFNTDCHKCIVDLVAEKEAHTSLLSLWFDEDFQSILEKYFSEVHESKTEETKEEIKELKLTNN